MTPHRPDWERRQRVVVDGRTVAESRTECPHPAMSDTDRIEQIERLGLRIQPDGMDGWIVRGPLSQMGMRQGYPRYGAHRLREALDDAIADLAPTACGQDVRRVPIGRDAQPVRCGGTEET